MEESVLHDSEDTKLLMNVMNLSTCEWKQTK